MGPEEAQGSGRVAKRIVLRKQCLRDGMPRHAGYRGLCPCRRESPSSDSAKARFEWLAVMAKWLAKSFGRDRSLNCHLRVATVVRPEGNKHGWECQRYFRKGCALTECPR